MLISQVKADLTLQQQRWRCRNVINTNGPLIKAFGEMHLDRWWVDLKTTCSVVNGRRSTASTAVTKQLNWGKSDPVYTDSAKTADLAKGRLEKMLFWHATTVFLMRHHTCWNQSEIQIILIVIFLSDYYVLALNSRKCAAAQVVSATCPASTGHQHVWPHWNTN